MKKNILKKFIVLISLGFVLTGFNFAYAEGQELNPVTVNLKIYAGDEVLFDGPKKVVACAESPEENAPLTINGKCAIEQIEPVLSNTWTWSYSPSGWLDDLGGYKTTTDWSKSWGWYSNLSFGQTGLNQHILTEGENLVLVYDSHPLRISTSKDSLEIGDTITFTSEENVPDSNYNMVWVPVSDVSITLGEQSCTTIEDGTCSITVDTVGSFNAIGSKTLHVPSETVDIEVIPNSTSINLKIYAGDEVLFDGPKKVVACAESPEENAPLTINGKCAIEQSGLQNEWGWSDFDGDGIKSDGFLKELGGVKSDDTNYLYWGWFSNLNYGNIGLAKHILVEGEELLLTYNSHPLRISASKDSIEKSSSITFIAEEKSSFNNDWTDMPWSFSKNVLITLGEQSCTTIEDGTCSITVDTVGSFNAIGSKTLHVPSEILKIEVTNVINSGGNSGSGGWPSVPIPTKTFSISSALSFLSQNKDSASISVNDWIAIAAGSGNDTN